jgi:C4-dicarboxylate-specific signal transduction histidine kinase
MPNCENWQTPPKALSWEHKLLEKIGHPQVWAAGLGVSGPKGFWRMHSRIRPDAETAISLFQLHRSLLIQSAGQESEPYQSIPGSNDFGVQAGMAFNWAHEKGALCVLVRNSKVEAESLRPHIENAIRGITAQSLPGELKEYGGSFNKISRLAEVAIQYNCFAHEVSGPLANLRATLELQQMEPENVSRLPERLQKAMKQVIRIENLMTSLRHSIGRGEPPPASQDQITDILEESLAVVMPRINRDKINLILNISENYSLRCRRTEITQAVVNLLNNSIDALAAQSEKTVEIIATISRGVAMILVQDNGPGIPPELEATLMEPYATTKGTKGTGLGLYLSRNLVESQSGALLPVTYENRLAFAIFLPV